MIYPKRFLEIVEKLVVAIGWIIIALAIIVMLGCAQLVNAEVMTAPEGMFINSQLAVERRDWEHALNLLGELRGTDPEYKTLEVDGLYFTALRNRGVELILDTGYHEMGLYYLGLAEQYAPLDVKAETYRVWAKIYRYADAEWGLDWNKTMEYYEVLVDICPYLHDTTGWQVIDRYEYLSKIVYATPTPTITPTITPTLTSTIEVAPSETLVPTETIEPTETPVPEDTLTPEETPTEDENENENENNE